MKKLGIGKNITGSKNCPLVSWQNIPRYVGNIAAGSELLTIYIIALLFFTLSAYGQKHSDSNPIYKDSTYSIAKRVDDLMARMTLQEKINQLAAGAPANKRLGIPSIQWEEIMPGVKIRKDRAKALGLGPDEGPTMFPTALAMGATWDPGLIKKIGEAIAREMRASGIQQGYGPVLGVARDPRFGRVVDTFGEDPYVVSKMGVAFINGAQGEGKQRFNDHHIIATGKHFAGYQSPTGGINAAYTDISRRSLYNLYFPPFKAAIKQARLASVMPAHEDLNGIPCHMNRWLLDTILRKKWGFDGVIVSDNFDINRLYSMHHIAKNLAQAAKLALKAGVDLDLDIAGPQHTTYVKTLPNLISTGRIEKKYVTRAVKRVLKAKFKLGLFDHPVRENPHNILGSPSHKKLALKAAKKSVVLLKNDDLLPLDTVSIKHIAIIGPHGNRVAYGDNAGKYHTKTIALNQALPKFVPDNITVNFARGASITGRDTSGFKNAVKLAKNSDVVILCIGGSNVTSGEGHDRQTLGLPGVQQQLFDRIKQTEKPVVVVLHNGRPLAIPKIAKQANAIIEGSYMGTESAPAMSKVLVGTYNPGGKLVMSIPRNVGQLPVFYEQKPAFNGSGHGKYVDGKTTPLYPFGLSYTTFTFRNLRVADATIGKMIAR